MPDGGVVHATDPVEIHQTTGFYLRLQVFKGSDAFLEASASTAQVVPLPEVSRTVGFIVPSRVFEAGLVPVNDEALARYFGVIGHRERGGRENGQG